MISIIRSRYNFIHILMSSPSNNFMFRPAICMAALLIAAATPANAIPGHIRADSLETTACDSVSPAVIQRLTDDDYKEVAEELGVEIPAIKAVVEIEAGREHRGFHAPGKPLINFDLTMFRRFAQKRGVNLARFSTSHADVFRRPDSRKHGSYQGAQYARFKAAHEINAKAAIEGSFWGMFQIGGFNWKKCGAASIEEFVERMSRSEREQLELFACFISNTGLLQHLKNKNWSAFARGYNGANYARQRYHTRLAAAYAKHKNSGN